MPKIKMHLASMEADEWHLSTVPTLTTRYVAVDFDDAAEWLEGAMNDAVQLGKTVYDSGITLHEFDAPEDLAEWINRLLSESVEPFIA